MNPKFPTPAYSWRYLCTALLALTASAAGQAGRLDPTFGSHGIVSQGVVETRTSNVFSVGAIAIQGDGKIVVAGGVPGANDFTVPALLRFQSNGSLDLSFGSNGVALLPNGFGFYGSLAIQSDGKLLVGTSDGGGPDAEVDRFTSSGHLDSSFGSQGRVSFQLSQFLGLAVQPDGRILVSLVPIMGGPSKVARLLSKGGTDTTFGTNGFAFPPGGAGALEVLSSGEILVFSGLISRLTSSGAIDTGFGVNGQLLAQTSGHALAADGDILIAGMLESDPTVPTSGFAAFAYQSVGVTDPAFGKNGGVFTLVPAFPRIAVAAIGVESTGDIVELGTASTVTSGAFGLVRYTPQGQLDGGFGSGGIVTTSFGNNTTPTATAVAIQSDDKIVAAGTVLTAGLHGQFTTTLVLARYLAK